MLIICRITAEPIKPAPPVTRIFTQSIPLNSRWIGQDKKPGIATGLDGMANRILIQPFGVEHTFFIRTLIGMRTEVVTLCLNQVRWQNSSTIAVVICHRSGEGRNRDTILYRVRNNITQRLLIFVCNLLEVRRQQKVRDTCIFSISIGDFCRN